MSHTDTNGSHRDSANTRRKIAGVCMAFLIIFALTSAPSSSEAKTVTHLPSIEGTLRVGSTLQLAAKSWQPKSTALGVTWFVGKKKLSTRSTSLTILPSFVGKRIHASVKAKKDKRVVKSAATRLTRKVALGIMQPGTATIVGTASPGQRLTATSTPWTPSTAALSYAWYANGALVPDETGMSIELHPAQAGQVVSVRISGSARGWLPASVTSTSRAAVTLPAVADTSTAEQTVEPVDAEPVAPSSSPSSAPPVDQLPVPSPTPNRGTGLAGGAQLSAGQFVQSANGRLTLLMQSDGNLVLLDNGTPTWWTGTTGDNFAVQQSDGNLVVYRASGPALWSSNTGGFLNANLEMQDDGNAVIYHAGLSIWSNGKYIADTLSSGQTMVAGAVRKSANLRFTLAMQSDGNLVYYDSGTAIWSSGTSGDNRAVMQADGNLVVYRNGGGAQWNSGTGGKPGAVLSAQDDGNLVIYQGNTAIWTRDGLAADGRLIVPFQPGQTWYVCQGYNGAITHGADPALDLTTYSGRGSSGCYGGENDASGKAVFAPAAGYLTPTTDGAVTGVCINLVGGGSIYMGHLSSRHAAGNVTQGEQVGLVAAAGQAGNNGYAHVHLSARTGNGCGGSHAAFTTANNMKFAGVAELTYSGATNQWAGTSLRR